MQNKSKITYLALILGFIVLFPFHSFAYTNITSGFNDCGNGICANSTSTVLNAILNPPYGGSLITYTKASSTASWVFNNTSTNIFASVTYSLPYLTMYNHIDKTDVQYTTQTIGSYATAFCSAYDGSGSTPTPADINSSYVHDCVIIYQISSSRVSIYPTGSEPTNTRFDTFTIATSTAIATVTGYWNVNSTSTDSLTFTQTAGGYNQGNGTTYYATTSGHFNFAFNYVDTTFSTQQGTSTQLSGTFSTISASLFNTLNGDLVNFTPSQPPILITSTSTTLNSTSSAYIDISTQHLLANTPVYCGLSNIGGCLQNAITWAFYPTADTLSQFSTLTLNGKFPFTYIYQVGAIRNSLLTATSTASTSLTINLWKLGSGATTTIELISKDKINSIPFASIIYSILSFFIYIAMAEYIYHRVIRIHDINTP